MADLSPGPYIHIGADECPKDRWKACSKCRGRMEAETLKSERHLQRYFVQRIVRFLAGRGRRVVGWDEILEGGATPGVIVQSWHGFDGALEAARHGMDAILSPRFWTYLDKPLNEVTLRHAYYFDPMPGQLLPEERPRVLGAEINMWTDAPLPLRVNEAEIGGMLEEMLFPRFSALAEAMWSPPERDWDDFQRRLATHAVRLRAMGVRVGPSEAVN